MHYGEDPEEWIDHINGIRDDNRISNLRLATPELNTRNACVPKNNSTGVVGVRRISYKRYEGFRASIGANGKTIDLGLFKTLEDAAAARKFAKRQRGYPDGCGRKRIDYG